MIVTGNPIWDADKATKDIRPYIRCESCGKEIYMPDETYAGDPYYNIDDECICEDCFPTYAKEHWYKENYYAES